jgi:hypothetical protein
VPEPQVYTLLVQVGRSAGDGLPKRATGAALLCYAAARTERQAVDETVAVLRQAEMSPLEVESLGTTSERQAAGDQIGNEDLELMRRALDDNAVIVAQVELFED